MDLREGNSWDDLVNVPSEQNSGLTRVVPSDSGSSLLFLKVSQTTPPVGSRMPLGGPPLSQEQQQLIRDWIDQGGIED